MIAIAAVTTTGETSALCHSVGALLQDCMLRGTFP